MVIRTDRVGDLILSTPFLASLREQYPEAEITAWVSPYCERVLQRSALVDKIVTKAPTGHFDLAVALAPRSECLKRALSTAAAVRVGYVYSGRPLVRLLARRCLTDVEVIAVDPPHKVEHEVHHLDRLARLMGLPPAANRPLQLGISAQTHDWLVLHLGDRWFTNGWDLEALMRLGYGLESLARLVITAGPREAELLKDGGMELFDLRTSLSFEEWCELIGGARTLVAPDTGAVHVAAAMDTPVVVAYEQNTYEHCSVQWAPWMVPHRSLVKRDPDSTIEAILAEVKGILRTH